MTDSNYNLSLHGKQIPVTVHEYTDRERTFYEILLDNKTLSIYKDTLYTWVSDDPQGFSQAEIQDIGEHIINPQP